MIYLDHAATTPIDDRVLKAMQPFMVDKYGNASALYNLGRDSFQAMEKARKDIANILGAQQDTIIFTGSGTESDNLAVLGTARANKGHGDHIITSVTEHHAVLEACKKLEQEGFEVTYLSVDKGGRISMEELKNAITSETILISIMHVNNEIGTVAPIADIGREVLKFRKKHSTAFPLFHTDACQAAGYLSLDVEKSHVDLMTINGSKIYAAKGVGMLYKRRYVKIEPLIVGGGHEFGLRAGTQNIAGIIGLATALNFAQEEREQRNAHAQMLTTQLFEQLKNEDVALNGESLDSEYRLVNNLNLLVRGVEAEALVLYASEQGISLGTGSACATGSDEGSHVLKAIGLSKQQIASSIRVTFGKDNTAQQIEEVVIKLKAIITKLRGLKRYK